MFSFLYASLRGPTGRRNLALTLAGLSALTLAGCGGSSSSNGGGGLVAGSGTGGSGSFTAQFSAATGTNATTSDFSTSIVGGVLAPPAPIVGSSLTLTAATVPSNNMARQFILTVADTTLTVGKAYPLATDTNSLSYVETTDISGKKQQAWIGTGGTVTIDSISGKVYKFHITRVPMGPVDGTTTTPIATLIPGIGTFTVDGTGTATLP